LEHCALPISLGFTIKESTLDTVNNLGILYVDQGRLEEAEAMYQRVLQGKEEALGPDHTLTLALEMIAATTGEGKRLRDQDDPVLLNEKRRRKNPRDFHT
jgi:hypothetical protein